MYYLLEALLVGFYTFVLYLFFSVIIKNLYLLLLVVGFSKHLLGYFLGLHTWYCNYGEACISVSDSDNSRSNSRKMTATSTHLLRDSLIESLMFLVLGTILSNFLTNSLTNMRQPILFVSIGILLHILAEKTMIHKNFCVANCIP
jgi:hypothetical protein